MQKRKNAMCKVMFVAIDSKIQSLYDIKYSLFNIKVMKNDCKSPNKKAIGTVCLIMCKFSTILIFLITKVSCPKWQLESLVCKASSPEQRHSFFFFNLYVKLNDTLLNFGYSAYLLSSSKIRNSFPRIICGLKSSRQSI